MKLLYMSFLEWNRDNMFEHSFAGLSNYAAVLSDATFRTAFANTLIYTLVTVPGQMVLGLLAAVLINSIPRFRVTFRVIYYLPVITSWVIVSLVFRYIFNTEGMLNYLLTNVLHLSESNIRWLDTRWGCLLYTSSRRVFQQFLQQYGVRHRNRRAQAGLQPDDHQRLARLRRP